MAPVSGNTICCLCFLSVQCRCRSGKDRFGRREISQVWPYRIFSDNDRHPVVCFCHTLICRARQNHKAVLAINHL